MSTEAPALAASAATARAPARQAAALFALSALLAVVAVPSQPETLPTLALIAGLDLAAAVAGVVLPWHRWRRPAAAALGFPAFGVLGLSTWAFGGFAAGTGPFFVLVYVWLGLHFSRLTVLAFAPVAAAAYVVPLYAAGADPRVLSSTVVLVPIATAVGVVIAERVRGLEEARRVIEETERWRAALMSSLAHDVRTPLTVLRAGLDLLESTQGAASVPPERVAAMRRQVARIERMSDTLLDVERVSAGALQLAPRAVTMAELVAPLRDLPGATDLRHDYDPNLQIRVDPDRIQQVLTNLVANGARHGAPPVVLSAWTEGHDVLVEVRDHGPGLDESVRDRLFERFASDGAAPTSVGLGLWSARLLVEAHGGTIWQRPADPGCVFGLRLAGAANGSPRMGHGRARPDS